jgi:hypothetical protein
LDLDVQARPLDAGHLLGRGVYQETDVFRRARTAVCEAPEEM